MIWGEDYEAMRVPYANRSCRLEVCIAIVRGLRAMGYLEFHGEFYELPQTKLDPVPTKPVRILIGGFGDPALKRTARDDGFKYSDGDGGTDVLAGMLDKANAN